MHHRRITSTDPSVRDAAADVHHCSAGTSGYDTADSGGQPSQRGPALLPELIIDPSCGYWPTHLGRPAIPGAASSGRWTGRRRYGPDGPRNRDRAELAADALSAFGALTGQVGYDPTDPEQLGEIGGDLVANLLHLAHRAGMDPEQLLERGRDHFQVELAEEQPHSPSTR